MRAPRRRSHRRGGGGLARALLFGLGLAVLVGLAGWGVVALVQKSARFRTAATAALPAQPVRPPAPRPGTPAPPAPAALQKALDDIAAQYGEKTGIAVEDVTIGWIASVGGQDWFPQQSVSKAWIAVGVMDAIDHGRLSLDTPVLMQKSDRSVFNQPLGHVVPDEGLPTTVERLLRFALIESDNSANDTLVRLAGLPVITQTLAAKGITGIRLGSDERNLQASIAGLTWDPSFSDGGNFEAARGRVPMPARQQALDRYLTNPSDGATPVGTVTALARLQRGELLSPASTAYLLSVLKAVRTGPNRLKGGLSDGWSAAHKTGTGPDLQGAAVGINDVGLLTAPDGHTYAVAVFIPRTRKPVRERLAMIQAVSAATVAIWEGKTPDPAGAAAQPAGKPVPVVAHKGRHAAAHGRRGK